MIVWLNGPFGVGKTAVADALLEAKPGWSLFDPEERGVELLRTARTSTTSRTSPRGA